MKFEDVRPGEYIDSYGYPVTVESITFNKNNIVIKIDEGSIRRSNDTCDAGQVSNWKEHEPTYTLTRKQLEMVTSIRLYNDIDIFLTQNDIKENKI